MLVQVYFVSSPYNIQIYIFNNFINFIIKRYRMTQSSLPQIFKKSLTIQTKLSKQPPSYSLHLTSNSPQKYVSSRAGYAPAENTHVTLMTSKARTMSMEQVKSKQPILKDFYSKKNDDTRNRIRVSFREDVDFASSAPFKQKLGMSTSNPTNFPYENNRRFNNNTIDLEESENLKNKLQSLSKEMQVLQSTLREIKQLNNKSKAQYYRFCQNISDGLDQFAITFGKSMKQCYNVLSFSRRETNQELKGNKLNFQKLKGDMNICSSFTNDLKAKTTELFQHYVKTPQQDIQINMKGDQLNFDFEEISSIKKSSRGATGDISRKTRRNQLMSRGGDQLIMSERDNRFMLNGKEIDLLNFQDQY